MASTPKQVAHLNDSLKELPINMRFFSVSMRALYNERAVSSRAGSAAKFNKLRDDTRRDALVYVKGLLPVSATLVRSINEFFEYYIELDYDNWVQNLGDIVDEVKGYKQCCTEVVKMHEDIMAPLKRREDEAKILVHEFKGLSEAFEKKKADLEASAKTKMGWAIGLALLPGINFIACPLLAVGAESDAAEAAANSLQCKVNEAAILAVSETMIPALKHFIDSLNSVAGFFHIVENELTTFQGKGEKTMEGAKKLHYTMMNKKALEIKRNFQAFFAVIPEVRSDFSAIPNDPSDQNYIDTWLAKKKAEIHEKYKNRITSNLGKMISCFSLGQVNKLMLK